jgi:hypothetical protein
VLHAGCPVQVVGDHVACHDLLLPLHVNVADAGPGPQVDGLPRDTLAGVGQLIEGRGEGPTSSWVRPSLFEQVGASRSAPSLRLPHLPGPSVAPWC